MGRSDMSGTAGGRGWSGLLGRLGRRTGSAVDDPYAGPEHTPRTVREEFPHRHLLRSSAATGTAVRDLLRELPADARRPVVVVDVPPEAAGNLGEELGSLLARLRDKEPLVVRLVLSGAAAPAGGAGPLAQRLADAWRLTLEAPDAPAVLTPGGMLYVAEPAAPGGGWWRFAPGAAPEALGPRLPAPRWQRALSRVAVGPVGACVARPVPAGLLLSPADAEAPRPDAPAYAATAHPDKVSVLLGVPRDRPVPADDVATLLAGLPAEARRSVRLVPADGREAVVLTEEVCDLLGTELEVTLGIPVAGGSGDSTGPDGPDGTVRESVRLLTAEGEFTWSPPLTSLVCSPARADGSRPVPRPRSWSLPQAPDDARPYPAALPLPSGARAVAVRSGLWIGTEPEPPGDVRDRPADPRALRVTVDPACLTARERNAHLKSLGRLLDELGPAARDHTEIITPPDSSPELVAALRRFAVTSGLALGAAPATGSVQVTTAGAGGPAVAPARTPTVTTASAPPAAPGTATAPSSPAPVMTTAPVAPAASAAAITVERSAADPSFGARPAGGPTPSTVSAPPSPVGGAARPLTGTPDTPEAPGAPEPPEAREATVSVPVSGSLSGPAVVPGPSHDLTSRDGSPTACEPPTGAVPVSGPGPRSGPRSAPDRPSPPAGTSTAPGRDAGSAATPTAPPPAPATPATPAGRTPAARRLAPAGLSDESDRRAFRELAADVWEEHSGPVGQALLALPALRGSGAEGASVDLVAVRLYLSSGPDDPFGARAVAADPDALRPYAVCLASGLRRLPALRGTLVRAVPQPAVPRDVVPGTVLRCDAPLDVGAVGRPGAPLPPEALVRYVIRSVTARRTSVLAPGGDGALFAAGTSFTVLARRERGGGLPARVLLTETPPGGGQPREPSAEALEKLDAPTRGPASDGPPWPVRCTGPFLQYHPPVS
ncbi:hypothetical protein ABZ714_30895 [Streptomyces sp. NPDC006798]|uniref:hypothetical protein n=1 Tax=Streptomyces sp. NPDC006798 TaxID=3155462 RepID=UPI003405AB66